MLYTRWVESVLQALRRLERPGNMGVGFGAIAEELGFPTPTDNDYRSVGAAGHAVWTALEDLGAMGLVEVVNFQHGNKTTALGRDAADGALADIKASFFDLHLSDGARQFLARIHEASVYQPEVLADYGFVATSKPWQEAGLTHEDPHSDGLARFQLLGDLEAKGLVQAESHVMGNEAYRPTYKAAVVLTEEDPRNRASAAGLIDWSEPSPPAFDAINARLTDVKTRLAGARADDDFSDIGNRCRDIAADLIDVACALANVETAKGTSRQDADRRLGEYMAIRAPGEPNQELRQFLRATLALASARTHSARTGVAAAIGSAQGLIALIRTIEAVERSAAT